MIESKIVICSYKYDNSNYLLQSLQLLLLIPIIFARDARITTKFWYPKGIFRSIAREQPGGCGPWNSNKRPVPPLEVDHSKMFASFIRI